jgi:hypothetical protein
MFLKDVMTAVPDFLDSEFDAATLHKTENKRFHSF